ncbi:hypothetical protein [Methylocella tundrae]|uniref:Uncharacterized protein n=1 Tax=Methylocella tundrae TaxID=227605 RepID=A0A4U8Z8P9_METTU|nr:hypothetical protein [Methylocella tundrae]WPP02759.1 hypothetical protein SIN04_00180 [Methylocella tundrae]VFU17522.1 protein of unknown function [Methylocella tundrae]
MDNEALNRLIAARRADAGRIHTEIVIACERAACRSRRKRNQPSDWNKSAWRRYILAAAQTPPPFHASLRKIYDQINALEHLAQDPSTDPRQSHSIAQARP